MTKPAYGLYEALLDEDLNSLLQRNSELRSVFGKLDPEEEPSRYAAFVSRVLEKALRLEEEPEKRLRICNEIIDRLCAVPQGEWLRSRRLIPSANPVLLEITPPHYALPGIPRPVTGLTNSTLFTGSPSDPQLIHELQQELRSADSADILVSFIKWSGLRLLMSALEEMTSRGGQVRVITTSYMGASDAEAVEWLGRLPNTTVRVSYDTERTRLHAKAYQFHRNTGFSTAYIGSANMSQAAMTSGLEWNLKVSAQDMPHILDKFVAEFETYWNSREFLPFNPEAPQEFRNAIHHARTRSTTTPVFFDLRPHSYQERILDALQAERTVHDQWRNLIVAATGTGKTVVAAFDFARFFNERKRNARLLFVAHRREILEQAAGVFRAVLRIADFGELLVGPHTAVRYDHLFCSVDMIQSRRIWEQVGAEFYDYIVVDEVHHGPAASYRHVFDEFKPRILLGLTATPERMDGASVAADFGNRFAAEIRLPEALEEKLLCPFQYFGIADPVSLANDRFWRGGKYDVNALEDVFIGTDALAGQRVEATVSALLRFEPDLERVRGIAFCATVKHAEFMADHFNRRNILSAVLVGDTDTEMRAKLIEDFRAGRIRFLFTRDVLNEGLDVPEINTVLFLRPTESLTVFLQQLGRGLRHAPGKDCLTVIDLVGQTHRRYRIDRKLKALLSRQRFNIMREVEMEFPHLPPGCSIQLDRLAREHVLANIRENLRNLHDRVVEQLETFEHEAGVPLTFDSFVRFHEHDPLALLDQATWTEWKSRARLTAPPTDPDIAKLRSSLVSAALASGPQELRRLREVVQCLQKLDVAAALERAGDCAVPTHYRLWNRSGTDLELNSLEAAFSQLAKNPTVLRDLDEVLFWAGNVSRTPGINPELPFRCALELHATYGFDLIKAFLGRATFEKYGMRAVGLIPCHDIKAYIMLITFQKTEWEFTPEKMHPNYPISRELLHLETPVTTRLDGELGQNLVNHQKRGYSILIFARTSRGPKGLTTPFTYLGPADLISHQDERPMQIVWRLRHAMPAELFEENRRTV